MGQSPPSEHYKNLYEWNRVLQKTTKTYDTQNIPYALEYSQAHYLAHNSLPLNPIHNQTKPAHIRTPNSLKDYFNIIPISTSSSSPEWSSLFVFLALQPIVYFHSPVAGFSLLLFEVSRSHTTTRHSR